MLRIATIAGAWMLLEGMAGTYRDKTVADKLIDISNYNTLHYPFIRLKLLVDAFAHST